MKRTFVAVKVDAGDGLRDAVASLRAGLKDEMIKWVDINNMHITLAFIGDTEETMIRKVGSALKEEFNRFGIIEFGLAGFGVFRNISNPRIIFTGILKPEKLAAAHVTVKSRLESLGLKLEERPFSPHVTIGRIKDLRGKNNLQKLIEKYSEKSFQEVAVSELVYYESVLLPTGPLYKPLDIINLM